MSRRSGSRMVKVVPRPTVLLYGNLTAMQFNNAFARSPSPTLCSVGCCGLGTGPLEALKELRNFRSWNALAFVCDTEQQVMFLAPDL